MTTTPSQPARFPVLGCAFGLSFFLNVVALLVVVVLCFGLLLRSADTTTASSPPLPEKHHSGPRTARDKVAVVSLEGVILEGMLDHVHKQIDQASQDDQVKAVVLRINSPGGSITASDDLFLRLQRLRDGDPAKSHPPRPLVVSMGAVAASGGYYVAVPAKAIYAERTTQTGSIGVYASFPNIKELGAQYGFRMNTIKAGKIKDSGSMFRDMSPEEQRVLQDMVDEAYVQFLDVISKGREKLTREKLLERFAVQPQRPDPLASGPAAPYQRYRADGGVFSADKAKEVGLIDAVGTLDDAVAAAAQLAQLDTYQAFRYQKTRSLSDLLLGVRSSPPPAGAFDPATLRAVFTPRLWFLAPGHEAAGMLAAAEQDARR